MNSPFDMVAFTADGDPSHSSDSADLISASADRDATRRAGRVVTGDSRRTAFVRELSLNCLRVHHRRSEDAAVGDAHVESGSGPLVGSRRVEMDGEACLGHGGIHGEGLDSIS